MKETGYYDMDGIPICVGDLVRCKHYIHRRCNRQMWLYFRVAEMGGRFFVQNWDDLNPNNRQCLLEHCGLESSEVLAESGLQYRDGELCTFNERSRRVGAST